MPEPKHYRSILWTLVLFVLVLAAPGWYIQKQMAQKMYLLKERVTAMEEEVAELKRQVRELRNQPTEGDAMARP